MFKMFIRFRQKVTQQKVKHYTSVQKMPTFTTSHLPNTVLLAVHWLKSGKKNTQYIAADKMDKMYNLWRAKCADNKFIEQQICE